MNRVRFESIIYQKEIKMNFSDVNWLAVLVCLVVSMIVGSVWFNPKTFFPAWWQAIGKTGDGQPGMENMGMTWGLTVLASFVQAVAMWFMTGMMGNDTWSGGMMTGLMLWLGFVAPASLTNKLFAGQLKAWAIEAGNHLVTYLLFGAIMGVWR
jgi:hypothetical protein